MMDFVFVLCQHQIGVFAKRSSRVKYDSPQGSWAVGHSSKKKSKKLSLFVRLKQVTPATQLENMETTTKHSFYNADFSFTQMPTLDSRWRFQPLLASFPPQFFNK